MVIGHDRHPWVPQKSKGLVYHGALEQSAGFAPVVTLTVLIQVHHRLLNDILGAGAGTDDCTGNRQQPTRVQPDRLVKQFGRRLLRSRLKFPILS
jgi:hypothetical protein